MAYINPLLIRINAAASIVTIATSAVVDVSILFNIYFILIFFLNTRLVDIFVFLLKRWNFY